MNKKIKFLRNSLVAVVVVATGFTLGIQSTAALWADQDSLPLTASSGAFAGTVEMNGVSIPTTATGDTYKTAAITLNQANVDSIVATGKVAIPLAIKTNISGQAAISPLLSITTKNWNNDTQYIEPSWKLYKIAEGQTCKYSNLGEPNFIAGENTITLNGSGNSNSNPYLIGSYNASAAQTYQFCLVGTAPVVNCESGKVAIHLGYANGCGVYSNTGTVKFDKYDGTIGQTTVTDTFNKVTLKYDWANWGTAIDKDIVASGAQTAAVNITLGYKITSLDGVLDSSVSNSGMNNIPSFG